MKEIRKMLHVQCLMHIVQNMLKLHGMHGGKNKVFLNLNIKYVIKRYFDKKIKYLFSYFVIFILNIYYLIIYLIIINYRKRIY